jgi:predicted enzyme related to lactoylglutathione lyase
VITGVDFIPIPAQDVARAIAFYRDTLGLKLEREHPDWAEFACGTSTVGLVRPEAYGGKFEPLGFAAPALHVDDIDAAVAALAAKGIKAEKTDTGVCHMVHLRDTEGNAVLLHNRYAPEH